MHLSFQLVAEMENLRLENCKTRKISNVNIWVTPIQFIHPFIVAPSLSIWIPTETNHRARIQTCVLCFWCDLKKHHYRTGGVSQKRKEADKGFIIKQVITASKWSLTLLGNSGIKFLVKQRFLGPTPRFWSNSFRFRSKNFHF